MRLWGEGVYVHKHAHTLVDLGLVPTMRDTRTILVLSFYPVDLGIELRSLGSVASLFSSNELLLLGLR